ncbi:hypothetical protein [Streptomyces sp. NPDC046862]|uniref:hypothetical protein n=1 Tax=Streptomyces sp. NPDC046862 TaxID=3154603 RepID=UPI0034557256
MKASPAVRSLRAAVFAVLCVLLATGGHALATGAAPPVWAQVAAVVPVFAIGWRLAGRERSLLGIGGGTLTAQGGLHLAFGAVSPHGPHAPHAMTVMHGAMTVMRGGTTVMHGGMTVMGMRMAAHPHVPPLPPLPPHVPLHVPLHVLTSHPTAAHATAAVVLTWWLRRGEAALWSLLRRAVAFVPGLVAWWRVRGGARAVPGAPRFARGAAGGARVPRQVLLRYAVHRRGPPASITYAT